MLILTARGTVSDSVQRLNASADDYLPKPFDLNELEARVRPCCTGTLKFMNNMVLAHVNKA